ILQEAVNRANDAPFSSDVARRARVAGGIFGGNQNRVTDPIFAGGGFHRFPQSGLTLGASDFAPSFSASSCCRGSSAYPAPVRLSSVTSLANSFSDIPSVPPGRCGKTK